MRRYTSLDYGAAGLATLSRQIICKAATTLPLFDLSVLDPYYEGLPPNSPLYITIDDVLLGAVHRTQVAISILDVVTRSMIILTQLAAFPLFLQVFNRFYGSIEAQIELEEMQLRLLRKPQTAWLFLSPLHFLILGEYCEAFQSHIDAHKAIIYAPWETATATVTRVIDGDTIKTDAADKTIRILPIDCPEMPTDEGIIARDYAVSRLLDQTVDLVAEKKCDKYSRILARVYIDGVDFGEELKSKGLCAEYVLGQLFQVFKPNAYDPLPSASVTLVNTNLNCTTDADGFCTIQSDKLKRGENYEAYASHPDYDVSETAQLKCCDSLKRVKLTLKERV